MTKLIKYLKGSAMVCAIIAPLMMMLEVVMDLYQPILMANIIDIGVANGDIQYVLTVGVKMILVALVGAVGGIGCSVFAAIASMKMAAEIRESAFDKIQGLSFLDIDKFKTSSLITRLTNDVTQIQNMVLMGLKIMVRAPLLFLGGVIMAISISANLSKIFLVAVPIIIIGVTFIIIKSIPVFSEVQKKIDKVNLVMRESLLGIRVIKAFVLNNSQEERFDDANEELMDTSIKGQNITMILWPITTLVMNLSVVAVLWFGGNMVNTGSLEIGKIMAFINYLTQMMGSLMIAIMIIMNFSRAKVSAERINEVIEADISVKESSNPQKINNFDIEFNNVSFRYNDEGESALEDISFKVNEGETVGIIGATGEGKSTLVSLIPRLYDVTQGEVKIGGINVKDIEMKTLRDNIGIVLQESILFSGTLEDNIRFGNENATEEEMDKAAKNAQAYEFVESSDLKYKREVEQRAKNLSGGQKQRLSITRTLIRNPKILILDDSSSALDMATEAKLQNSLKENMSDSTVFIISQRISGVMDLDKIIVLDEGKVNGIGNHKELLKTNEIYRSIAVSQLGEEVLNHE